MARRLFLLPLLLIAVLAPSAAQAAPPVISGTISGAELAPQSLAGAAVFLVSFKGTVDGRSKPGFGMIRVNHEDLPTELGGSSDITGGTGTLLLGLTTYQVTVDGGLLTLVDTKDPNRFDDAFAVEMNLTICGFSGCRGHVFQGLLDHEPFPPTIAGTLGPAN